MANSKTFEELEIWQSARQLYRDLNPVIDLLRKNKEYRFAEELKSSAGSIMDNIAEGFERKSRLEFIHFLGIASGETGEVKSQLYRCKDDCYITEDNFKKLHRHSDILSKQI